MKEPRFVQDYLRDILEANIPLQSLAGMRDKLIHDYAGVSLEVVWRTVKEDIPPVRPLLIGVLEKMHAEEG